MYNDYEREEILDTAMDIFENTDATLEEAMGVAMENQTRKLKAEARKTGNWDKVIMRQGLKDTGKAAEAKRSADDVNARYVEKLFGDQSTRLRNKYSEKNRPPLEKIPERFPGEAKTKQYYDKASAKQRKFDKNYFDAHWYMDQPGRAYRIAGDEEYLANRRRSNMGDYSKSVPANNGRGTQYAVAKKYEKASKEAAIMDTALDYMDMYDVSMETAIDMAYEDYED